LGCGLSDLHAAARHRPEPIVSALYEKDAFPFVDHCCINAGHGRSMGQLREDDSFNLLSSARVREREQLRRRVTYAFVAITVVGI
jgi:hypothetical protein